VEDHLEAVGVVVLALAPVLARVVPAPARVEADEWKRGLPAVS
jgi:hypothetical protein